MGSTTEYKLPWPELPDAADGPDGFQKLATATENALKAFGSILTASSGSGNAPGSTWATACEINGTMPAGQYMLFAEIRWSNNWGGDGYTWIDITANGQQFFQGTVGCRVGGDGNPAAYNTWSIPFRHPGGALRAWLRYGFAVYGGVTLVSSRITAVRVGS